METIPSGGLGGGTMETIPSGGLGGGTIAISPAFTRDRRDGLCTEVVAVAPGDAAAASLRIGLVTLRKVGESMRSGTRLARTVARIVTGLAIRQIGRAHV